MNLSFSIARQPWLRSASVFMPVGHYSFDGAYFASQGVDSPPLHALQDGVDGANAVYLYSGVSAFPTDTYNSSNYWVDVVFDTESGPDTIPPVVTGISPGNGASGVLATRIRNALESRAESSRRFRPGKSGGIFA